MEGAHTEERISHVNTTIDPLLIRQYLAAYFFPRRQDGRPNRTIIDAALPKIEEHFAVLDRAVPKTGHLVGDAFRLVDMNLLRILFFMDKAPESHAMLGRSKSRAAQRCGRDRNERGTASRVSADR